MWENFASQLQTWQPLSPTHPSQQKKNRNQEAGHLNVCSSITFSVNESNIFILNNGHINHNHCYISASAFQETL
jgi:hypothetical protein